MFTHHILDYQLMYAWVSFLDGAKADWFIRECSNVPVVDGNGFEWLLQDGGGSCSRPAIVHHLFIHAKTDESSLHHAFKYVPINN